MIARIILKMSIKKIIDKLEDISEKVFKALTIENDLPHYKIVGNGKAIRKASDILSSKKVQEQLKKPILKEK